MDRYACVQLFVRVVVVVVGWAWLGLLTVHIRRSSSSSSPSSCRQPRLSHTHPQPFKPPPHLPQLDKEEAQTEQEEAAGQYADIPRPGGARERIRAEIRKEDAEAYKRLANA